ncbi:cytochrome c [Leptospira bourretii]|uniref:Cytochrome c n=1 Tax=Leptospira bourretii TaxID=2484962 RepID=A0A4R9IP81_9LEPT|nr:c-type cytochrome [Leptospira bourretii]TGK86247.1 cytochrome c [Leptospira bourretii]TGK92278.1 cytochrome c [Leptospira bourretii]TGL20677.1 cytochrome c [Leptospira bourretii]TGL36230.1 cytochrome c [Leptospira bourretii]
MLSKSQARAFFLGGTFLFSAIFVFLTVDTLRQNDFRTNAQNMTADVLKGKEIWEKNNCMGCHTLLGEGAYYAPDLTKVVERRGATWIDVFLDDPQAMFPGERKMIKYGFNKEEKGQIIAFLDWVGKIDANGWPPKPNIPIDSIATPQVPQAKSNAVVMAQPEKFSQLCVACHAVGGKGGNVGPALDHVGSKFDSDYLNRWLSDPQAIKPGTNMPKLPLTDPERKDIVTYLSALK